MAGEVKRTICYEAGSSELSLREEWWKVGLSLPPNRAVILREDGVAKAVVRVFWRDALLAGISGDPVVKVKAAGIGWVFTRPDARGRSLAHDLMKETHRWLVETFGVPAVFLYCRAGPGLYDDLGYVTIREEVKRPEWKEPKRLMGLALTGGVRIERGQWSFWPEDPF